MSVENRTFENEPDKEQVKSFLKWAEGQRIKKTGTPEQIKEVEEEERMERESAKKETEEVATKNLRYFDNLKKLETGTPEEKRQAKKELDAGKEKTRKLIDKMLTESKEQLQINLETIKQQTYDKIKRRTEEHRRKYGIEVSPAELKREDQELRERLGMK